MDVFSRLPVVFHLKARRLVGEGCCLLLQIRLGITDNCANLSCSPNHVRNIVFVYLGSEEHQAV